MQKSIFVEVTQNFGKSGFEKLVLFGKIWNPPILFWEYLLLIRYYRLEEGLTCDSPNIFVRPKLNSESKSGYSLSFWQKIGHIMEKKLNCGPTWVRHQKKQLRNFKFYSKSLIQIFCWCKVSNFSKPASKAQVWKEND